MVEWLMSLGLHALASPTSDLMLSTMYGTGIPNCISNQKEYFNERFMCYLCQTHKYTLNGYISVPFFSSSFKTFNRVSETRLKLHFKFQ